MDRISAPTLQDVARVAGVSTATVSRCFNSPDKVNNATLENVMRIVDELGYTPHFGGRMLASNRSNTVGVVIPTMENAIFARGLQAFQETLAEAKMTMLVASSGYDSEAEYQQIRTLVSQGADGLLLIGSVRPEKTYSFLQRRHIPYVLTWNFQKDSGHINVGFDNRKAACAMAQLVIEYGHRNIGMISANIEDNDRARDRVAGVREAMNKNGLCGNDLKVVLTTYSLKNGGESFEKLMALSPRPTVVICGNDVLGAGAINKAREMGIKIPDDVSITGFDDIELAEVVDPKLTTVHVPHRRMGETAARLLLQILNGQTGQKSVELETEIIIRESLGAKNKAKTD